MGFEGVFVVETQGRSGGLALFWKESDQAKFLSFSQNHIDVEVKVTDMNSWRLTGFYGEPNRSQRRKTWDLLRTVARDSNLPWCVIGDGNNVVSQEDKKGGPQYPCWLVEGFNQTHIDTGLRDMELVGHQYTCERGIGTGEWIEIRIDKALTSSVWLDVFPLAKFYNLEDTLDHSPILLEPKNRSFRYAIKRFQFENAWLTEPLCAHIVKDNWEGFNMLSI